MNSTDVSDPPWISVTKDRLLALGLHPLQYEASVTLLNLVEFDYLPAPTVSTAMVQIPNRARILRTSIMSWISKTPRWSGLFLIPYSWGETLHVESSFFVGGRQVWCGCSTNVPTIRSTLHFVLDRQVL